MKSLLLYFCSRCGGAFAHPAQCGAQPAGEAGLKSHSEIRRFGRSVNSLMCVRKLMLFNTQFIMLEKQRRNRCGQKIDQQKVQCDDVCYDFINLVWFG